MVISGRGGGGNSSSSRRRSNIDGREYAVGGTKYVVVLALVHSLKQRLLNPCMLNLQ